MSEQNTKNKVFINEHDVIEVNVIGDQTAESVTKMCDETDVLIAKQRDSDKSPLVLDSLADVGKVPYNARRVVVDRIRALNYDKLAFVSNDTIIRFGSNLIMQAIGRGNSVKHFESYEQAITWLTADRDTKR